MRIYSGSEGKGRRDRRAMSARSSLTAVRNRSAELPLPTEGKPRIGAKAALESDFQDVTSVAHEPSSSGIGKGDRPEAVHPRQFEPSTPFIWSPDGWS